jgi:putative endopeptidase
MTSRFVSAAVSTGILSVALAQSPAIRSGLDLSSMDRSVRPQDDLYRFANGRWLDATEIPADRVSYGTFVALAERAEADVREIVEAAAAAEERRPGSPAQQMADLYASMMDTARLEALGDAPIRPELQKIDAIASPRDLATEMGRLSAIAAGGAFAGTVGVDARGDPTVQIAQGGTLLPDRDDYFSSAPAHADVRARYVEYLTTILTLARRPNAADDARAVLALETSLARIQTAPGDARDPSTAAARFTLDDLPREMPGFDWRAWAAPQGIDRVSSVVLLQPSFFRSFARLTGGAPPGTWRAWLAARYITASAPYLNAAYGDARFVFFGRVLTGQEHPLERWKRGVSLVNTFLGDAAGRLYVEKRFGAAARERVASLTKTLVESYREAFTGADWMSPPARAQALKKLARLKIRVGYPDRWREYRGLVVKRDDLIGNVRRAREFENARHMAHLDPYDRGEWTIAPQTVNAAYSPSLNEIVLPPGILQPPLFDAAADDAANYGGIGAIVAHEIAHGFDDRGRRFDASGAIADWWSPGDERAFEARAQALVRQFDACTILGGAHVNGALTRGENLGDAIGLTIAYRAYQRSLGGRPSPAIDGFTGEQRFFLAWAQMWRTRERDEYARQQLLSNPYAPPRCRANGIPPNLAGFHDAFAVKPGDAMFRPPSARTVIW